MSESPKLLDRVRAEIRARHYSRRTEEAYTLWIRRYILFHNKRHPSSMGGDEVNAFLTKLAVEDNVSASIQGQALSALLFLYRVVLSEPLPWLEDLVRARRPARLPVVLTADEVAAILERMKGPSRLVVQLLYGSGLRLLEALMLRIKDVDFGRKQIHVRDPKGRRDRITMLPRLMLEDLKEHLEMVRALHRRDLDEGFGGVWLRRPSDGNCRRQRKSGRGSGYFRRRAGGAMRRPEWSIGIVSTKRRCRKGYRTRSGGQTSRSA